MKFVGVMIVVRMLGGSESPIITTEVLALMPMAQCESTVENLNKSLPKKRFSKDGKIILYERRQCALILDSELHDAQQKMNAVR